MLYALCAATKVYALYGVWQTTDIALPLCSCMLCVYTFWSGRVAGAAAAAAVVATAAAVAAAVTQPSTSTSRQTTCSRSNRFECVNVNVPDARPLVCVFVWLCPCILCAVTVVCRCHYHIRSWSWSIMHTALNLGVLSRERDGQSQNDQMNNNKMQYMCRRHRQSSQHFISPYMSVVQLIRSILIDVPQQNLPNTKSQLKKVTFVIVCCDRDATAVRYVLSLSRPQTATQNSFSISFCRFTFSQMNFHTTSRLVANHEESGRLHLPLVSDMQKTKIQIAALNMLRLLTIKCHLGRTRR